MFYYVKPGDTLWSISKRLGVSGRFLARQNNIRNPNRISAGTRLKVPTLHRHTSGQEHHVHQEHHPELDHRPLANDRSASSKIKLGDLSMRYETGYEPGQEYLAAAKVSSGLNDPGGVSYGAYQLNSKKGDKVRNFLAHEGAPWQSRFEGLDETERNGEFGEMWKTVASESPQSFFDAQHAYIKRTNYGVTVAKVEKKTGVDLDTMSIAVRNVVWSVSVQHGGAHLILERALHDLNADDLNRQTFLKPNTAAGLLPFSVNSGLQLSNFMFSVSRSQFERDLIIAIYKERRRYIRVDANMDAGNISVLDSRYDSEQKDALQELEKE